MDSGNRCVASMENAHHTGLADDMLQGAAAIGSFMGLGERQVYHQRNRLPVFKIGALLCARKSTLMRWIAEQEAKATGAS